MKSIVLRYGGYAALFEFICFVLTWLFIFLFNPSFATQGNIGYVSTIAPLIFIYFGIRYYRDKVNNGGISFLNALKLGLLMTIVPALSFAVVETVYVLVIDPKFYENVYAQDLAQYRKTHSPAEFTATLKEANQQLILDKNPFYNFMIMILTIGSLGTIVTLISSALLMRKPKQVVLGQS